jgi:hypothetical protein
MRHNYVCDIGDFYKYKLLRELTGLTGKGPRRKLGIIWYLNESPCKPNDGNYLHYLKPERSEKWMRQDPELFDALAHIVKCNKRHLSSIEQAGILGRGTKFYTVPLPTMLSRQQLLQARQEWLKAALVATKDCDIVFFDPDNGLEVASTPITSSRAVKYVYFDELKLFIERGQSLVIYQHKNMHQAKEAQITERTKQIKARLGRQLSVDCHYFAGGGGRMFFVIE